MSKIYFRILYILLILIGISYNSNANFGARKNTKHTFDLLSNRNLHLKDQNDDSSFVYSIYANKKKLAIKIDPISFFTNAVSFSAEKSLSPRKSLEIGIGFVNPFLYSKDESIQYSGVFIKLGFKQFFGPGFYIKGGEIKHPLSGMYLKPDLVLSSYSISLKNFPQVEYSNKLRGAALIMNLGHQWVYSGKYCIDVFTGLGFGLKSFKTSNQSEIEINSFFLNRYFGFKSLSLNQPSLAFQLGLKFGVLLGKSN